MMKGKFRSDLYFRLKQIEISIPSLSERSDDIPELVRHFLKEKGFDFSHNGHADQFNELCSLLSSRDWPGNVRELENFISTQYTLSGNDLSRLVDLIKLPTLSEREILLKALEESHWNRREVARKLGISEGTIRNRIRQYDLIDDPSDPTA